jgi:hypothetical protein
LQQNCGHPIEINGCQKDNITPYHQQTNAQAEVCNKTIAAYLKTQVLSSTLDWEQYIPP